MKNCPTEAIRIIRGTAQVNAERCIDCGQCLDACPYEAISIEQDDFSRIFSFQHRIAVFPALFFSQFSDDVPESWIAQSLYDIGFTDYYESEFGVDILKSISSRFSVYAARKPVISSYCPAVVRLIQIKYHSLVDHINLLRTPMEITSLYVRQLYQDKGISAKDVGVFYVTPCAAKIADIKTSEKGKNHLFDGVINLDYLYNLVCGNVSKHKKRLQQSKPLKSTVSGNAAIWSLAKGESAMVPGRSLAVDEIHNVIEFLESYETNSIEDLDFLELRACSQGCAGGVLTPENKFLTSEKVMKRAKRKGPLDDETQRRISHESRKIDRKLKIDGYEAHNTDVLDDDISEALKKMDEIEKISTLLPGLDCGLCGSPSCEALARDIVLQKASWSYCGVLHLKKSHPLIQEIWGNKFSRNS